MFFRREKPQQLTFEDRLGNLKQFGFETLRESTDNARVTRGACGAVVKHTGEGNVDISSLGVLVNGDIGVLLSGGYQMFLRTSKGLEVPARAEQLKALHAFEEDLREGLGLTSLYNQGLGTTSKAHMYDRVEGRDSHHHARPWEHKA